MHWANITSLGNKRLQKPHGHRAKCEYDNIGGNEKKTEVNVQCIHYKENPLLKILHNYYNKKNITEISIFI